jgi:glucokinase
MDLVADIGGTNARFALVDPASGALREPRILEAVEYPDLASAARAYLASVGFSGLGDSRSPQSAAFAVAAPTRGTRIEFTNSPWVFEPDQLRGALGLERLVVLNDFAALALAVPSLPATALQVLKPGVADSIAPCAVLGPGTGLGVAAAVRADPPGGAATWRALSSQGGHIGFAPADAIEVDLLRFMQARVGRVSVEHLLSGRGLVDLHAFMSVRRGAAPVAVTAAQVSARAIAGDDPDAVAAVERFCAILGGFAGDVALLYGAWGGVYIGGGIAPRFGPLVERSEFVARFAAKGPMAGVLAPVPVWLIHDPHAALHGAAIALR